MKIFAAVSACLVAASLHAVAEPDGVSGVSPKPEDSSVKAALARGCRVGVWFPYWRSGRNNQQEGILLSFAGAEGKLTISSSSKGPQTELKVLSERILSATELAGLEDWKVQPVGEHDEMDLPSRLILEEPDGKGQHEYEWSYGALNSDELKRRGEITAFDLIADAAAGEFERSKEKPEDPDFIEKATAYQKEYERIWNLYRAKDDSQDPKDRTEGKEILESFFNLTRSFSRQEGDALLHAGRVRFSHIEFTKDQDLVTGDEVGNLIDDYRIVAVRDLSEEEAKPLLAGLRNRLLIPTEPWFVPMCYSPHDGVKIWDTHGNVICEGTVCLMCSGYRLKGPSGAACKGGGLGPALRRAIEDLDEKDGFGKK